MTTYDEYREQMALHTRETAHFSFTRTDHPAFQKMLSMGKDLAPHLLHDLLTYRDDCSHEEFLAFNPWTAMSLLAAIAGADRPIVSTDDLGRLDPLCKIWVEWGKQRGYLFIP